MLGYGFQIPLSLYGPLYHLSSIFHFPWQALAYTKVMYSFSPSQLVPVQVLDEQGGFRYYQACWHPPGAAAARVFVKELLYTDDPHLHARQFHEACVMERLGEAGGHAGVTDLAGP